MQKSFLGFHSIPFFRGSASDNWRNDSPQTNGFQSSGQKTGTNNYYSERNGFRSDRNDRSSPLNESSGFGGVWSRGRGRFNSSGGSRTDRSFNSSPASEPLRIEVSNDYIGKVIGELISINSRPVIKETCGCRMPKLRFIVIACDLESNATILWRVISVKLNIGGRGGGGGSYTVYRDVLESKQVERTF